LAELKMHTVELAGHQWDWRGWLLRPIPYSDPELFHPEDLIWPIGINNFRIQYTAGYATVPESVQQACALWVAESWYLTKRDPALTAISMTGLGNQVYDKDLNVGPPTPVRTLLAPYRRCIVGMDAS
jgi:hypothetical protein